jgi:hypothetical protein
MMDRFEERHPLPALDEFRDRLGEEFTRISQSRRPAAAIRSPGRIAAVALLVIALGAGVAVAATQISGEKQLVVTAPNGETQTIGQTQITVTEQNGATHSDVMNNGIIVGCSDGTTRVIPEADPNSEQAKQDALQAADKWCQNAPEPTASSPAK